MQRIKDIFWAIVTISVALTLGTLLAKGVYWYTLFIWNLI